MDSSSELLPSYDSCACGLPIQFFFSPELSAHPIKKTRRINQRQFPIHLPSPKNFLFMFNQLSSISGPVLIGFPPLFHPPFPHFPATFIPFSIKRINFQPFSSHFPATFQPFSIHFPPSLPPGFTPADPQDALEILRKAPKPSASQELRALQLLSQAEKLLTNRCWC